MSENLLGAAIRMSKSFYKAIPVFLSCRLYRSALASTGWGSHWMAQLFSTADCASSDLQAGWVTREKRRRPTGSSCQGIEIQWQRWPEGRWHWERARLKKRGSRKMEVYIEVPPFRRPILQWTPAIAGAHRV